MLMVHQTRITAFVERILLDDRINHCTAFGLYQYYTAHAGSLRTGCDEISGSIVYGEIFTMSDKESVDYEC